MKEKQHTCSKLIGHTMPRNNDRARADRAVQKLNKETNNTHVHRILISLTCVVVVVVVVVVVAVVIFPSKYSCPAHLLYHSCVIQKSVPINFKHLHCIHIQQPVCL